MTKSVAASKRSKASFRSNGWSWNCIAELD